MGQSLPDMRGGAVGGCTSLARRRAST
jgi:hypothetical protein